MAPPAKSSGYVASITEAMAPPAERPVTNILLASAPNVLTACSTICLIESASPCPRVMSPGKNHEKQLLGLLAGCCCGYTIAKPKRSASDDQPVPRSYSSAVCVHP